MKKAITLLLAVLLFLCMPGCVKEAEKETAYEIYERANAKIRDAASIMLSFQSNKTITVPGLDGAESQEVELQYSGLVKQVTKNKQNDIDFEMDISTEGLGLRETVKAWYTGGMYYLSMFGVNTKTAMPLSEIQKQVNTELLSFADADIIEQSVKERVDGYDLTFKLEPGGLLDALNRQVGNTSEVFNLGGIEHKFNEVGLSVFIDGKGEIKSLKLLVAYTMTGEGREVSVVEDNFMEVLQLGGVTIAFPEDLDSYIGAK